MPTPSPQRIISWLFLGFWSLLLLSGLGFKASAKFAGWPRWGDHVLSENRTLNSWPDLRATPAKRWGSATEAWYNDHFAWRTHIIKFYRYLHFDWLHTTVGKEQVPGKNGWIFRKGGNWAELEDYLGAFELTPEEIGRWRELFEGRKQWAEAHGILYLEVITPVKAQIHPEMVYPMIARHRGQGVRDQVRAALQDSPARDNVLFLSDLIAHLTLSTTVFYASDHHVNAYGTYMIFKEIRDALAARLGPMEMPPFYTNPPPGVVEGTQAGCFEKGRAGYERLFVSVPGMNDHATSPALKRGGPYPSVSVVLSQPGARRTLVLAHDSFLRYPLSSWRFLDDPIRLPVPDGFDRVLSMLFKRLDTYTLDHLVSVEQPAVVIEQFPEIKLTREVVGYDDTMRRAAAFSRAMPIPAGPSPSTGTPLYVMAILEEVTDESGTWVDMRKGRDVPEITADLCRGPTVLASVTTYPGKRRALFFPLVQATGESLEIRLRGGHGNVHSIEMRTP